MKHKKKHKEGRKHKNQQQQEQEQSDQAEQDSGEQQQQQQQNWNVLPDGGESYRAIKEQCLKQKLSISLKRLNTNAYARCDYPVSNASSGCKSSGGSSDELSEHEPEVETAPDFPPHQSHPLMMRLAATPVAHCLTANGRRMDVGDVVWGKIHGFPWWPGKVSSTYITIVRFCGFSLLVVTDLSLFLSVGFKYHGFLQGRRYLVGSASPRGLVRVVNEFVDVLRPAMSFSRDIQGIVRFKFNNGTIIIYHEIINQQRIKGLL